MPNDDWRQRLGPLLVPVWQKRIGAEEAHRLVCQEVARTHVFDDETSQVILKIIRELADRTEGDSVNTTTTMESIVRCNLIPRQNVIGIEGKPPHGSCS